MMDVAEKLDHIEKMQGAMIAFDGCHKIYVCEDDNQQSDAIATGYDLHPSSTVRDLVNKSCGLVFISRWGLADDGWTADYTIEQGGMPESWYGNSEEAVDV